MVTMIDVVVGGIIIVIVGAAIVSIRRAKKKGIQCIGCDASTTCGKGHTEVQRYGCSRSNQYEGCNGCQRCEGK